METLKIALVGDVVMTRELGKNAYSGFDEIATLLIKHDIRFGNLEMTVHDNEGYPSMFPGGTWIIAYPNILKSIKRFGFNIMSAANNHSMDYSHNGLLATIKHLNKQKLKFSGIGKDLCDASKPSYIDIGDNKIALISTTSSFHDSDAAGNSNNMVCGRPGVNHLRHRSICEIESDKYDQLSRILSITGINDYHNQAIKEGYLQKESNLKIGYYEFVKSNINNTHTEPNASDMSRIIDRINEAKQLSNCIIVSLHTHQFANNDKEKPAEFVETFAHNCIDNGAKIIVCHGPHLLRGIEIYNNGIIFYSLGNFIFQNETVPILPEEFFEKYNIHNCSISDAFDKRSQNETKGLCVDKRAWQSVIASIELSPNNNRIMLYPIELGVKNNRFNRGVPRLSQDKYILETLSELSKRFKTIISINNQIGTINF